MSKSLKRVIAALHCAELAVDVLEMHSDTRTAQQAALAAGCEIDQIAKSIIFRGQSSQQAVLFITAGGNQVEPVRAAAVAHEPLARADATFVRQKTGFAIGGVAPIGHETTTKVFFDPRLLQFDQIWAAAGTPRHIFSTDPQDLARIFKAQVIDFTA